MGGESAQLDTSQSLEGCSSELTRHPSCENIRKTFREATPLAYHLLAIFSMSVVHSSALSKSLLVIMH